MQKCDGADMTGIRLHRIYFPVVTLGYGQRLGVWVMGCGRRCPGCISPEMQSTDDPMQPLDTVLEQIPTDLPCDGLTISGGEPFDQPEAVAELARWYRDHYNDDILIYTGYTLHQLRQKQDPAVDRLISLAAAIVDGPYMEQQNRGRGLYGSENQTLHLFRHADRYRDFETAQRRVQCVAQHRQLVLIGVPPNGVTYDDKND
jgi:anaerobic ribonucleoside-triphosphate reductase activating protein